jgi:CDP-glucose 4,6-dehydratase
MVNSETFWEGKRVLITGHTGFKGAWLTLWLQDLGAIVCGYSLEPPTTPSLYCRARASEGIDSVLGDVLDLVHLTTVLREHKAEVVFHMAAQSLVRVARERPVETFATNVMGTVHLLEAARQVQELRAVVVVTSDKCYENCELSWGYRETDRLGGDEAYSASKACSELVTAAYRQSYHTSESTQVGVATVRSGNVIGGGDWARDRLIPDIISAFLGGKEAVIRQPRAVRPWQHVLDPLKGYMMVAERLWDDPSGYSDCWNFGPSVEDAKTVQEIADRLAQRWGGDARWVARPEPLGGETMSLRLDSSRTRHKLGWKPHRSLDEALDRIVGWYRAFHDDADMRAVTLKEIREYMHDNDN